MNKSNNMTDNTVGTPAKAQKKSSREANYKNITDVNSRRNASNSTSISRAPTATEMLKTVVNANYFRRNS
jgi:hypothetical protein